MITKNILYKYFKDFADNHLQIKDYGYGDLWEISSSQATTYPLFWVSPQPSSISGNEISYNFNILIGDRLEDGDANKVEVESDTFQIGLDLLATLNLDRELDLDKNNTLTPFIHDFKDRIAGHLITLSVSAPFDYNECAVPTTGTPQPPASSCPSAFITINGVDYGSVLSGGTEDILVIDGSGNQVGSLVSGNWVVTSSCPDATAVLKNSLGTTLSTTSIASGASANITAPDSTITINSASFLAYPSGATSNILVKDGTGTQVGSKVGSEWIVPTGGVTLSGVLFKTIEPTQYTSYRTGDIGWRIQNGLLAYTPPTSPKGIAELDYTSTTFFNVLKNPLVVNGVSSTTRFVDVDGSQTFSATNNKNLVVIDKLTGLMYTRLSGAGVITWNDNIDNALAYSIVVNSVTYDDWYLACKEEYENVYHQYAGINASFDTLTGNQVLSAYNNMSSSTTSPTTTTDFYYYSLALRYLQPLTKAVGANALYVRYARNLITAP